MVLLYRFKGVAGVHAIVSVTSGELGGRTFPTTIRRGKGQCIKLGRGLLALIQVTMASFTVSHCPGIIACNVLHCTVVLHCTASCCQVLLVVLFRHIACQCYPPDGKDSTERLNIPSCRLSARFVLLRSADLVCPIDAPRPHPQRPPPSPDARVLEPNKAARPPSGSSLA